ncbi:leucine-rich repeat domain-containing protein, partial [Pannus brasiliensis CCIBt3594]
MSDLELLRHLEEVIGRQLTEVPEERFHIPPRYSLEGVNAYALSGDGNVIGLYFRYNIGGFRLKISDICRFKNLVYLYLIDVKLRNFVVLEKLKNLQSLVLVGVGLTDMSFTGELTALTSLDLSHNEITAIRGLENLTALTSLDLSYNGITAIRGLENLTALTSLDL